MPKFPQFKKPSLLRLALTHRSYCNEHPEEQEDNERLEFLGDALLGFLVGELLYRRYPDLSEGQLTLVRSELVREKQLVKFAIALGIGDKIRLGKGTIQDGGRQNPSLLSDAFEAIVGAYFLDSGIEEVRPNWRLGHQQQLKNQWVQPSAARPIRAEKIELSTS